MPSLADVGPSSLDALASRPDLAVLVDLDGTLVPFAATPREASLDSVVRSLLSDLVATGARLVIVTGRAQRDVEPLRPLVPEATWIAEHGACRAVGSSWEGPTEPAAELALLAAAWSPLAAGTAGAWIEAKSLSLCFHWRSVPAPERDAIAAQVEIAADEWLETEPDYERLPGTLALEVRRRGVHKGTAVRWIRQHSPDSAILAIGDDVTDEDMFAALGDGDLAVLASPAAGRPSHAALWVDGPVEVRRLLGWLAERRRASAPVPAGLIRSRRSLVSRPSSASGVLVISNRTPAPPSSERGREVGGLVSALGAALGEKGAVWLGWSGRERDGDPVVVLDEETTPQLATFDMPPAWRRGFYAGQCNRSLWPLLHGLVDRARYQDSDWAAYVEANAAYAGFAGRLVTPDAPVWVHDYHLFLVARALREKGHQGPLGLFVHVPFPSPDAFETCPWASEIVEGMCAFDLVGFHTARWADNFVASARHLGHAPPTTEVFPLGVDIAPFAPVPGDPVVPEVAGLGADLGQRRLLLGVDRLDYSKGIPERLLAYERLLERWPEWRRKVVFVQVSVPSRADVPEYAELRRVVENLVGRVNGRFGEADWVPVRYLFRSYGQRVLADLYRAASVAVVTPLADGMNLVAKEFVAAQRPDEPGVLVLSRFAGAAVELEDAILTNPYHVDGMAVHLDRALRMSLEERRARHTRLRAALDGASPARWAARFMERLGDCARPPVRAGARRA